MIILIHKVSKIVKIREAENKRVAAGGRGEGAKGNCSTDIRFQ